MFAISYVVTVIMRCSALLSTANCFWRSNHRLRHFEHCLGVQNTVSCVIHYILLPTFTLRTKWVYKCAGCTTLYWIDMVKWQCVMEPPSHYVSHVGPPFHYFKQLIWPIDLTDTWGNSCASGDLWRVLTIQIRLQPHSFSGASKRSAPVLRTSNPRRCVGALYFGNLSTQKEWKAKLARVNASE